MTFDSILVANRGEIACRIIHTARNMGLRTVAVHSDSDRDARHVHMADKAIRIGPPAAGDSYLRGDAIIAAALQTGAAAIHPGYGFLSENPDFVEEVEAAGLIFVGPPAPAIRAMGLKDAAKALMARSGIPVVPGYHGEGQEPDLLAAEAGKIGYPVLIKARAGGGGKGMRLVERAADFAGALESARREGQATFGDPAVLVEKYVATPRHIEIQVLADAHGNVVHLFERDCSMQRRHQKVIEEAPAPGMTAEVRAAMGAAAVETARAIGYVGAGTVEFIVDGTGPLHPDGFWFMEMNTRLQVEHPVTEAITGLDLVELQLRIAAGECLPFRQEDLRIKGHAIEARVYAEDPGRGFLPATGRLEHLLLAAASEFTSAPVRIDAGIREGDEIGPHYDPMIAKVIAHGTDRAQARARLSQAIDACRIVGPTTNLGFLSRLIRQEDFAAGLVDTGLIGRNSDALTRPEPLSEDVRAVAMVGALNLLKEPETCEPWQRLRGWRAWGEASHRIVLEREGETLESQVSVVGGGAFQIDGTDVEISPKGGDRFAVIVDGTSRDVDLHRTGLRMTAFAGGQSFFFRISDLLSGRPADNDGGDAVTAPMPGLVSELSACVGDRIFRGDRLVVLEAMKMEHVLTAPRDGTVSEVLSVRGAHVSEGAILLRLEPEGG